MLNCTPSHLYKALEMQNIRFQNYRFKRLCTEEIKQAYLCSIRMKEHLVLTTNFTCIRVQLP